MRFRKYALIVMLGLSLPAMAQMTTLIESVEASTSVINVPTTPNGRLSFKPCAERCDADYISVRLTPETRFLVNGQAVSFAEFRMDFHNRSRGEDGLNAGSF